MNTVQARWKLSIEPTTQLRGDRAGWIWACDVKGAPVAQYNTLVHGCLPMAASFEFTPEEHREFFGE